jgi:hypothetical protein
MAASLFHTSDISLLNRAYPVCGEPWFRNWDKHSLGDRLCLAVCHLYLDRNLEHSELSPQDITEEVRLNMLFRAQTHYPKVSNNVLKEDDDLASWFCSSTYLMFSFGVDAFFALLLRCINQ